jgi:tetratricopeptide (TPR) repeat protein
VGPRAGWALAGLVVVSQAVTAAAAQLALRLRWVPAPDLGAAERLLTEGRVVLRYLELFVLPLPSRLTLDYDFAPSRSLFSPPSTLPAIAAHAALIAFAVWVSRRRPLLAFGILGFYLLQLPEGTFMPLDLIFEHRAYFPAFFLALALMDLLLWAPGRLGARHAERWALAAAVALGVLWGGFGYRRNQVWADPVKLWEDTVAKAPGNARAHNNLGEALLRLGNPRQAARHLQEAVRLDPTYYEALSNLGVAELRSGNPRQAVGHLQEAVRLKPDYPAAVASLGAAHSELGNLEKAVGYLREGVRLLPESPEARCDLGMAYLRLGNPQEAVGHLREAVRLSPELPEAHAALGAAYSILGNPLLAYEHLLTAVRLKPGAAGVLYNLGNASASLGRLEEAAAHYRAAIGAGPEHAAAHLNLGLTLLKLGRAAEARAVWQNLRAIDPERARTLQSQLPGAGG